MASAATFAVGASVPVLTILFAPLHSLVLIISIISLLCLAALGTAAARLGGAPLWVGAARVAIWGAVAMAVTDAVGRLFGTTVG
jgi:VIT1/CCC1 family predicted Fe2+/Mn2+ transporter